MTVVPDIQLMPPTPQQTTLTESGSSPKPVSKQPTVGGEEGQMEERDEGRMAEEERTGDKISEEGSMEEGIVSEMYNSPEIAQFTNLFFISRLFKPRIH